MPQAGIGGNSQTFYSKTLLRVTRQRQVSCQQLVFIMVFEAFDRYSGDKFLDQKILGRAVSGLPVPESATARKETRGVLCQMIGQGDETGEKLVGTVASRLTVRAVGIGDTALMGNFTDQVIRRGICYRTVSLYTAIAPPVASGARDAVRKVDRADASLYTRCTAWGRKS